MSTIYSPGEIAGVIAKDATARKIRFDKAVREAVVFGAVEIAQRSPTDLGDLTASIHPDFSNAQAPEIVVGAAHAAAVETGIRPTWIPVRALLDWIGRKKSFKGKSLESRTKAALRRVLFSSGYKGTPASYRVKQWRAIKQALERNQTAIDKYERATVDRAYAIQASIAKKGIKPRFFVKRALAQLVRILDNSMKLEGV